MANIIIIGGGVAGLSAGIYAQLCGHNATIYEKHFKSGGNLTGWDRKGYHIDNCIHWLTGTNPSSSLYKMWCQLGVLGDVEVFQPDTLYTFKKGDKKISLSRDINKLQQDLTYISPEDKKEIISFIKAIKMMQKYCGIGGENYNKSNTLIEKIFSVPLLIKYYNMSTLDLAKRFKHPLLQSFFVSIISEYFSALALILMFANFTANNGGIPVGSSCEMAKRMTERFISLGGKLVLNKTVTKINIDDKIAKSITLDDNSTFDSDYVIVTIDPAILFGTLLDKNLFPIELKKQYKSKKMLRFSSYHCAFSCNLNTLPFKSDLVVEIPKKYRDILNSNYLLIREFSHEKSFSLEGKNIIQTMIYCKEKEAIEFIELNKNQIEYNKKKQELVQYIKKIIEEEIGELKGKLECIDTWTPSTYKKYTNTEIGSYMSFALPKKTLPIKLSNRVNGVKNVVLATQWLQPPGGLPIAATLGKESIETINNDIINSPKK